MMRLYQSVHTLLGFAGPEDRCRELPHRYRNINPVGEGLRCIASDFPNLPRNVLESYAVAGSLKPPGKPDPCIDGSRFVGCDDGGGLGLCTESLGFESCCDRRMGEEEKRAEQEIRRRIEEDKVSGGSRKTMRSKLRGESKKFPPPLPWLINGRSGGAFMRSVKKDGRLLLTEVRVDSPPEILRATRQDGRLMLHLVRSQEEEEAAGVEEGVVAEEEEKVVAEEKMGEEDASEEGMEGGEGEEEEEEEEERMRLWRAAMKKSEGEGWSGRCQGAVGPHLSCWNPRFVTTA